MVTRRPTPEHQDAVARRLALLSAEIAGEHTRVRPPPVEVPADVPADVPAEEPPSVAPIPVPGRHASRRSVSLLPEGVRGRIALGSAQLAVVAVLVALG